MNPTLQTFTNLHRENQISELSDSFPSFVDVLETLVWSEAHGRKFLICFNH